MSCPTTEDFAELLANALDDKRRAAIVEHAADCADCCALLALALPPASAQAAGHHSTVPVGEPSAPGAPPPREPSAGDRIGRYQLLELVGAGGMGVVWGAWDPRLERRVAIKLIHPEISAARTRILAEGQALSKLAHPNVVTVHDVGILDDQVYLVMEWVQGQTLRAFAESPHDRRDLIDAYRQAAEGLDAAHRAGLIHRDFKPDNAIRGEDGRVRVLDFGLALSGDGADEGRRIGGTPRYMAPEQATGGGLTPAVDQYAFAVSLREALTRPIRLIDGRPAPLPGWLAAIVARGTSTEPGERFASMAELVRALGRDPARRWRRRGIAALAAAGIATAYAIGQRPGPVLCAGSAAEIAHSWSPAARVVTIAHLRALGAFGAAEADQVGAELDRYGAAWVVQHRAACLAHERGELPDAQHARRVACLARGAAELAAVTELITSVPADGLANALVAARALPSPAGCASEDSTLVAPPPDAVAADVAAAAPAVERARVLALAKHRDAVAVAEEAAAAAERTHYTPLVARAALALGWAQIAQDTSAPASRPALQRALDLALRSGDDALAVEAYARLIWAVGRFERDVVGGWEVMDALAERSGAAGRFGRALLYNNKATARLADNDRAGARRLLERAAAAMPGAIAPGDVELLVVPQNLALATDDPVDREARVRRAVSDDAALLGPRHPNTLSARMLAATLIRNPDGAAAELAAACEGYAHWHPQLASRLVNCSFERGWLADERGDTAGATAAMRIAATDPAHDNGAIAVAYLAITGATTGATTEATIKSIQQLAGTLAAKPEWWTRGYAGDAYITAAIGWDRRGDAGAAAGNWRAALEVLEPLHQPIFERRIARAHAALAMHWASSRPDDAAGHARAAIDWYRAAGGYPAKLADLGADRAALSGPRKRDPDYGRTGLALIRSAPSN